MLRCFLLFAAAFTAGAAGLDLEWERGVEVPDPSAAYSAAVCPDGTFYLADGIGGVAVVGGQGALRARRADQPEFRGTRLAACDGAGRLYLSSRAPAQGVLTVLELGRPGELRVVNRLDTGVAVRHLAFGRNGLMFAAGTRPGSLLPLHAIGPGGAVLFSFGEPGPAFILPRQPPDGFVFWLERSGRVLFVPRHAYELRVYDARGRHLETVPARPPGVIRPAQGAAENEVAGAAALPDGGIAVQASRPDGRGLRTPAWSIDLYGPDLGKPASLPSLPGILAGADADGGLYFITVAAREIAVAKGTVKRPGRQRFLAGVTEKDTRVTIR